MKSSKVDSGKRIEERKKMKKKINPLPLTTHHSLLAIWTSGTTRKIHRPCNSLKGGGDKIK